MKKSNQYKIKKMTQITLKKNGQMNSPILSAISIAFENTENLFEYIKAWHLVEKLKYPHSHGTLQFVEVGDCLEVYEDGTNTLTIKIL